VTKQTLEQERAADALSRVAGLNGQSEEFKMCYQTYVERLGVAIVTNGLGQALATERSAAGPSPHTPDEHAHHTLYDNVQRWLCRDGGAYERETDLLEAIVKHDEARYLVAQTEALAWLQWHKKFCRALLPKGSED